MPQISAKFEVGQVRASLLPARAIFRHVLPLVEASRRSVKLSLGAFRECKPSAVVVQSVLQCFHVG